MSVKALINYVLEEVAIDGEQGTSIEELYNYINSFYKKHKQGRHNVSELLWADQIEGQAEKDDTNDASRPAKGSEYWGTPNVEEAFQEYVWDLLKQEKDFLVGANNGCGNLTLREIVEKMRVGDEETKKLRVFASEDRRWRTLTGHGPDWKKVPNAVFKCLEVIGKHREQGLIQPELTAITGQDKKSIAGRTTLLKDLGYIEKVAVLARSMNTSKLTLTKFAIQREQNRAEALKDEKKKKGKNVATGSDRWTGETIHTESLVRAIIAELKAAKNGVVQRGDLKKRLGMDKSRFHWRTLSRMLRKVEAFGVWRRIRVPLATNRTYDRKGAKGVTVQAYSRCLKFIRDITNEDWRKLSTSSKLSVEEESEGDEASDIEQGEKDNEDVDVDAINEQLSRVDVDAIQEIPRDLPRWNVYTPTPNIVFNLIQSAEKDGLSSMDVVHRVIGSFYYRPMDQILHRMTDFPSRSQPPQYIHLAVIRETSITHRQTHYHYFSYGWHQELVKDGLAVEPWAIQGKKKGIKTGSQVEQEDHTPKLLELDEFGFPPVNASRLLEKDGSATLAASQHVGMTKHKPVKGRAPGTNTPRTGRPRKYEKGQEPYLAGRRRRAAANAAKAEALAAKNAATAEKQATQGQKRTAEEALVDEVAKTPKPIGRPPKKQKTDGTPVTAAAKRRAAAAAALSTSTSVQTDTEMIGTQPIDATGDNQTQPTAEPSEATVAPETPASVLPKRRGRPSKSTPKTTRKTTTKAAVTATTPQVPPQDETAPAVVEVVDLTTPAKRGRKPAAAKATPATTTPRTTRKRKAASPVPTTPNATKRGKDDAAPNSVAGTPSASGPSKPSIAPKTSSRLGKSTGSRTLDTWLTSGPKTTPTQSAAPAPTDSPVKLPQVEVREDEDTAMITVDGNGSAEVPNDESTVPTTLEVSPEPTKEVSDISPEEVTSNDQATSADQPEPEFAAESLVNETVTSMEVDEPLTTIETGEAPVDASVAPEPVEELPQEAPVVEEETSTIPEAEAETVSFDVDGLRVEAEKFEDDNQSYGSIGGMLALGRQQVVLDLVAEHDGVFPGGNELRHAFNRRYKKKNPKAGIADRRLIRGVVQSLQYKGKLNQYTFSFKAPRGGGGSTIVTKKVLVNPRHTMDSPLVIDTIRKMKAADGGLWFPPNTDLPSDIQEKIRNPITTWVQSVPSAIEDIKFDRMFPTSIETLKKQREARAAERALRNAQKAEEKRVRSELRALKRSADGSHPAKWDTIKFTDEQRAEARQRKAELELKMRQLRTKFIVPGGDEVEEERPALQTVWWNDFVHRDEKSFLADVKDVKQWEILNGQDNEFLKPLNNEDLAMINHFGPMVNVGSDFQQVSVSNLDHTIKTTGAGLAITSRTAYRPRNRPLIIYDDNGDPIVKKRRKREAKNPPAVSRRVQAMNDIHQTKTLDGTTSKADDEQEVHLRKDNSHRNKYAIPKEDEDTLLIAVIIVRTIFGNVDRKINWNVVQKALPQHETFILQKRWPRARDNHKTHLKKLQSEFEEMYLDAYAKGELPIIDLQRPWAFDVALHIKWFRENLELPQAHTVPELSAKREVFESLYNLRQDKGSKWRTDYHNPTYTMGNRANHFVCYAYELPHEPEKDPSEGNEVVEYVKSIIKANVITDVANYNPASAFEMIHAQPEDAVDEAFFDLTNNKVIAHRKEHSRVAPGRNYELTDKFHASLRTPIDAKMFAQALRFDRNLREMFKEKETVELSPFMNDGSVACVFDLIAHRRVHPEKREYKANAMGLTDGYETRSMPKDLVDFKVDLRANPSYASIPKITGPPPIPDGKSENPIEPIRIWVDMNGDVIKGMWLKFVTAVISMITGRPGINTMELANMLRPGATLIEVEEAVGWLMARGAVMTRDGSQPKDGCWPTEGFFRALEGL